ncbi:RHS repeat domain-containing protein, partial [Chryseobacterium joostei]|uniref:RHS repeat domain-containing protein n=1 Tax=Chryseobacterium joostei TaxID=112234 RepID=UPI0023F0E92D
HWHQVDDRAEQLLTENTYNELSQLKNKVVGNNLQSIDYAYNIRGWMTGINKNNMSMPGLNGKLFSYRIKYNQKDGIENPDPPLFPGKNVKPMYNGNIAEVDWKIVDYIGGKAPIEPKRYGYAYDALNRLTAGYYQNPNNPGSKENTEVMDYDVNGNISNLYRTSIMENGTTATVIDRLTYNYIGNRLTSINDISTNPSGYEGGGNTITYDPNGNMENMKDKKIISIKYNFLNLPETFEIFGMQDRAIGYKYSANGIKLQKTNSMMECGIINCYTENTVSDYLDGFQYIKKTTTGGGSTELLLASREMSKAMETQAYTMDGIINPLEPGIDPPIGGGGVIVVPAKDEDLVFFPTAEGYYDYKKDQYIYQYKDHLGNARVSFGRNSAGALEITDANDYYPFGMNHLKTGNSFYGQGSYKNYKYNGKELQETGMYDYGARMYMSDLGRWGVIDPRSQYTHEDYSYVWNNPISFNDPSGMQGELAYPDRDGRKDGEFWKDSDGEFYWDAKKSVWKDFNTGRSIITQINLLGKSKDSNNSGYAAATALGLSTSESGVGLFILAAVGLAYIVDQATKPPLQWHTTIADPSTGVRNLKTEDNAGEDTDVNGVKVPQQGERTGEDPLRQKKNGEPQEDPEAEGTHHTQIGKKNGRKGVYRQGREFKNGEVEWDYDITDHGRPSNHPNPHKHKWEQNSTGGTKSRSKKPLPIN